MNVKHYEPSIPSECKDLLVSIVGDRIRNLSRFSWWESLGDGAECGIYEERQFFSRGPGPLLMQLESGLVIGFSDDSSKNSVLVWVERDRSGSVCPCPLSSEPGLDELTADDPRFSEQCWAMTLGCVISELVILRQIPIKAKYQSLANEVGIVVKLTNGDSFVISHGIHIGSDNFGLVKLAEISPSTIDELVHISLN